MENRALGTFMDNHECQLLAEMGIDGFACITSPPLLETFEMIPWKRRNQSRGRYRLPLTSISRVSSKIVSTTSYLTPTSHIRFDRFP